MLEAFTPSLSMHYIFSCDKILKNESLPSQNNWVPRRGDQGPKTIDQIHKDAEQEEHREQMKVQHLMSKKDPSGGQGNRMGGGGPRGREGPHTPGRGAPPQDEGWNTVPISKNRPIDTSRLSKITKVGGEGSSSDVMSHCLSLHMFNGSFN